MNHPQTLRAWAKINLGLRILNKRPDGYHNIESIFHYIDWYDTLEFTPANGFSFSCSDTRLPVDDQNLVVRAVRRVESILGFTFPYHIHLKKSIPFGAGLGGGSSDAATVLRFAHRQWPSQLGPDTIGSIAAFLGSDINFFLNPVSQIATDRGIHLEPLDFTIPGWILTVFPPTEVPTGWAYQQIRPYDRHDRTLREIALEQPIPDQYTGLFINDFDEPISRLKPEISLLKSKLQASGATYVSLSGSGSACFAVYNEKSQAELATGLLSAEYPVSLTPPGFLPDSQYF